MKHSRKIVQSENMWCLGKREICLWSILLITLSASAPRADGANILGIFTSLSQSHLIVHMSVVKALAEQGHNITVVTTVKPTVTHESIRHILIPLSVEEEQSMAASVKEMASKKSNIVTLMANMFGSLKQMMDKQIDAVKDERFTALYEQSDTKFDLIILGYFMNDFQLGFAKKFNCPIIVTWMSAPQIMIDFYVGNPAEMSYVPSMNIAVKQGETMSFFKRVKNFFTSYFMRLMIIMIEFRMKNFYSQLFGNEENFPSYKEMQKNVSLIFCNSHLISEGPIRPLVPATVEIGGIQIKDKPDPLPKDIAGFLNSATNGAILLSLGSNLKGSDVKPEIVENIYRALSSLKQNVIWKWEDLENTPGTSPNILYKKWLPQDDILAHPNIKLFITHAGKGGVAEAQYHGVPMLAIPVFADQPGNADKIVQSGYGLSLDFLTLKEKELKAAILEILENPKYAKNLKLFSNLYRDRPLTAKQSVVYWAEYVIRHHGAIHMQSPLVHMNFIQSSNLDVFVFIFLVIYVAILIVKVVFKLIWKKLFKKSKKVSNEQNRTKKVKKN